MVTDFQEKVYEATRKIFRGKVSTYALIAKSIGKPKAARAVGNALNKNPFTPALIQKYLSNRGETIVPCHRIIRSDGSVGGFAGGVKNKIAMLKKEGIEIKKGKVVNFKI